MFVISVAGLNIGIESKMRWTYYLSEEFLTQQPPMFTVSATEEEIQEELKNGNHPVGYHESICLYREIAERLPDYDAFVFHGAAVAADGRAYVFTAPSGTGKTTHIGLWKQRYGEKVTIVNGDKPIIRRMGGRFYACGTPWCGREMLGNKEIVPVAALCLLEQAQENRICAVRDTGLISKIFRQVYLPKDSERRLKFLGLLDAFLASIPIYRLCCNMDISAAELSYETMTKQPQEDLSPCGC